MLLGAQHRLMDAVMNPSLVGDSQTQRKRRATSAASAALGTISDKRITSSLR